MRIFIFICMFCLFSCSSKQETPEPLSPKAELKLQYLAVHEGSIDETTYTELKNRIIEYDRHWHFWAYSLTILLFVGFMLLGDHISEIEITQKAKPLKKSLVYLYFFTGGFFGLHHIITTRTFWGMFYYLLSILLVFMNFSTIMIFWPYPGLWFSVPAYSMFTQICFWTLAVMLVADALFFIPYNVYRFNSLYFRKNYDNLLQENETKIERFYKDLTLHIQKTTKDLETINTLVKEEYSFEDENKDNSFFGKLDRGIKYITTVGESGKLNKCLVRLRCLNHCCGCLQDLLEQTEKYNTKLSQYLQDSRIAVYRHLYLAKELIGIIKDKMESRQQELIRDKTFSCDIPEQKNLEVTDLSVASGLNTQRLTANIGKDLERIATSLDSKFKFQNNLSKSDFIEAGIETGINITVNAITELIDQYSRTKKARKEAEYRINSALRYINKGNCGIQNYQAALLRQSEILMALYNGNKAFINAYEPLRQQVFGDPSIRQFLKGIQKDQALFKTQEFKKELHHLIVVCSEYNKINQAQI